MPDTVLFDSESEQTRAAIASYLRTVAESLENGRDITLKAGDQSVALDPPARSTLSVTAGRDEPANGPGALRVEFALEWDLPDDSADEPQDTGWTSSS